MSKKKKESKSRRVLFNPNSTSEVPFQLSRYRLENFLRCRRCFWLDLRLGVKQPQPHPYTLNSAVDRVAKNEFDSYRAKQLPLPLMIKFGIDGVPFSHPKLADWQQTTKGKGMLYLHPATGLLIMGAVDDILLVNYDEPMLSVLDTKATSSSEVHPIDDPWWKSYRRQLEIYTWLLKRMDTGYPVSQIGYFHFCNGLWKDRFFGGMLQFDRSIFSCPLDDSWVEPAIIAAHQCLMTDKVPSPTKGCEYCDYFHNTMKFIREFRSIKKAARLAA